MIKSADVFFYVNGIRFSTSLRMACQGDMYGLGFGKSLVSF